ncbi:MAG TPA: glycosyltransferase family 4 protein [Gemmataceae bacterium]|nr:glycosyltransferase family 4 protein [Gemmataceae bacterium]
MTTPRRLLTVGHSYAVALNRRLADEMARAGGGDWEVIAAAPRFMRGDLRPIELEPSADGCRTEAVPAYLTGRPHVLVYGRRLRDLLRSQPWDLVHCWEEPFVLAGAQVGRWAGPAKVVYYTFQNIRKNYPPPFNWVERYSMRRAAGWIAAGETVAAALSEHPSYKVRPHRIIPLGVDVGTFHPDPPARAAIRQSLGWEADGPPVVGYLGRFVPEKGLTLLTNALDRLRTPWRALFVGGGPREGELRSWAARLPDRVRVVTNVPHDGVPPYLNAMDVLAAPSQTTPRWREQLGRMLIEAFACGAAVVGSDSGEIPHVIGDAGLVLPEANEAAWVEALGGLLENPGRRADFAARGLERAQAEYAWPVIAGRHLAFFDELLSSHDKRATGSSSPAAPC